MSKFVVCRVVPIKGDAGGIGTETKRQRSDGSTYAKGNVDTSRSHLNRTIFCGGDPKLKGGARVVDAIEQRIAGAGIKRKISAEQNKGMMVYLSGSKEQMDAIQAQGKIDEWVQASCQWMYDTFGKDNVVSIDLHMDEGTPHLQSVVVPITTEPRPRKKREGEPKYNIKPKARLSSDHFCNTPKYIHYQDTYGAAMSRFGFVRGIRGSEAKHKSHLEFFRELREKKLPDAQKQLNDLVKEIEGKKLLSEEEGKRLRQASKTLKSMDTQIENKRREIEALTKQLEDAAGERKAALQAEIEAKQKDINRKLQTIEKCNATIFELREKIRKLEARESQIIASEDGLISNFALMLYTSSEEVRQVGQALGSWSAGYRSDDELATDIERAATALTPNHIPLFLRALTLVGAIVWEWDNAKICQVNRDLNALWNGRIADLISYHM